MKRLHSLTTKEISLVPTGANQKKFHVVKEAVSEIGRSVKARIDQVVKDFGKKDENGVDSELEGLSPAAQTAVRAVGRILAPHSDEVTDDHLDAIQEEVGIGGTSHGGKKMADEKVKPEHMKAAKDAAQSAYKEAMKKLGYQKYPEGELQMKDTTENAEKMKKAKEDEEEAEKAKAEKAKKEKEKMAKESILKEDGSINLEAVPAELRPAMEAISKSMIESTARAKAAETKAAETETVLKAHQVATRKSEIVRKSAEFKNLPAEDVLKTLELADKAGAEEFDRVVKMFASHDKLLGESLIFKEIGSANAGMSGGAADAWGKIEAAAKTVVQKSVESGKVEITKEQAAAAFLETAEGQSLYAQHQAARPNGI